MPMSHKAYRQLRHAGCRKSRFQLRRRNLLLISAPWFTACIPFGHAHTGILQYVGVCTRHEMCHSGIDDHNDVSQESDKPGDYNMSQMVAAVSARRAMEQRIQALWMTSHDIDVRPNIEPHTS